MNNKCNSNQIKSVVVAAAAAAAAAATTAATTAAAAEGVAAVVIVFCHVHSMSTNTRHINTLDANLVSYTRTTQTEL